MPHNLEWPGFFHLPFVIIDPLTIKVVHKDSQLFKSIKHLDTFENKYVKLNAVLEMFPREKVDAARRALHSLVKHFAAKQMLDLKEKSETNLDKITTTTYLPVSTLLAFVLVWPCCKSFQKVRDKLIDFLEHYSAKMCVYCKSVAGECFCKKPNGDFSKNNLPKCSVDLTVKNVFTSSINNSVTSSGETQSLMDENIENSTSNICPDEHADADSPPVSFYPFSKIKSLKNVSVGGRRKRHAPVNKASSKRPRLPSEQEGSVNEGREGSVVNGHSTKSNRVSLKHEKEVKEDKNSWKMLGAVSDKIYSLFLHMPSKLSVLRCRVSFCGQCLESREAAGLHHRVHYRHSMPTTGTEQEEDKTPSKNFKKFSKGILNCFKCAYSTSNKNWFTMLQHLSTKHHITLASSILHCNMCGMLFESVQSLRSHQAAHYCNRYKCMQCGRVFQFWSQLQHHLQDCTTTDTDKRLVFCPFCPFVFQKQSLRDLHSDSHCDEGLKCVVCHNAWLDWPSLRRHYHLAHPDLLADYCSRSFSREPLTIVEPNEKHNDQVEGQLQVTNTARKTDHETTIQGVNGEAGGGGKGGAGGVGKGGKGGAGSGGKGGAGGVGKGRAGGVGKGGAGGVGKGGAGGVGKGGKFRELNQDGQGEAGGNKKEEKSSKRSLGVSKRGRKRKASFRVAFDALSDDDDFSEDGAGDQSTNGTEVRSEGKGVAADGWSGRGKEASKAPRDRKHHSKQCARTMMIDEHKCIERCSKAPDSGTAPAKIDADSPGLSLNDLDSPSLLDHLYFKFHLRTDSDPQHKSSTHVSFSFRNTRSQANNPDASIASIIPPEAQYVPSCSSSTNEAVNQGVNLAHEMSESDLRMQHDLAKSFGGVSVVGMLLRRLEGSEVPAVEVGVDLGAVDLCQDDHMFLQCDDAEMLESEVCNDTYDDLIVSTPGSNLDSNKTTSDIRPSLPSSESVVEKNIIDATDTCSITNAQHASSSGIGGLPANTGRRNIFLTGLYQQSQRAGFEDTSIGLVNNLYNKINTNNSYSSSDNRTDSNDACLMNRTRSLLRDS